jgi:hypothetical protein
MSLLLAMPFGGAAQLNQQPHAPLQLMLLLLLLGCVAPC